VTVLYCIDYSPPLEETSTLYTALKADPDLQMKANTLAGYSELFEDV